MLTFPDAIAATEDRLQAHAEYWKARGLWHVTFSHMRYLKGQGRTLEQAVNNWLIKAGLES